jgi:hypothetical protein
VELHISDDGRGLALHKLYENGVASGLFGASEQPTPDAVADHSSSLSMCRSRPAVIEQHARQPDTVWQ